MDLNAERIVTVIERSTRIGPKSSHMLQEPSRKQIGAVMLAKSSMLDDENCVCRSSRERSPDRSAEATPMTTMLMLAPVTVPEPRRRDMGHKIDQPCREDYRGIPSNVVDQRRQHSLPQL